MAAEKVLAGRTLLVIGASSGIGRETARWAAGQGAKVAAVGRRRELLDRLVEEMPQGVAVDADVRDPSQCESLVARAVDHLGSVDAMVFAASASSLALTSEADAETWKVVLETNVMGPALVTRALLPHLSPKAFLAYLSSEIVGQPYHGLAHYACSKAALEELIRALRTEHPAYRFCCLRVGATMGTDFARDFSMELNVELLPQWIARAKLPSEFLQPDDVGSAIGEAVAIALARPGIDVQDLTLRPPGGPFTGDVASLAQMASEAEFGT
jgi:NAD(P)-dependent dehydrogenase (short-subunit alcohol dehydrogenase family)